MSVVTTNMSRRRIIVSLVILIFLTVPFGSNSVLGEPKMRCNGAERRALLKIKEGLYGLEDGVILSWGNEQESGDCCEWIGIRCDNRSGHVIKLDLSPPTFNRDNSVLAGNISSSLVDLQYLNYLDLSFVSFDWNSFSTFIGNLSKLRYLNLSSSWVTGKIPPQLGNLSSVQFLDLSHNLLDINNLEWVSQISSLRLLDLSFTNMSLAHDWVRVVNNLPHLTDLKLSGCDLVPPSPSLVNFSKVLSILDLSSNFGLSTSIFQWLFNYSHSLVHVDLSLCEFKSSIPEDFGNHMVGLEYLGLSGSGLEGSIPKSLGNMVAITYLDLSLNNLEGSIPESFGNITALAYLDLSRNQLQGSNIPETLGNLIALRYLDLSSNFPFEENGNQLDGSIPHSFGNLTSLRYLSLGCNQLKGSIPEGFGNMASLEHLDLSDNMLEGEIPKSIWKVCTLQEFQAFNNSLSGQLQLAESSSGCARFSLKYLDLSHNQITGSLPNVTLYSSLIELKLQSNRLNGNVSNSLGQLSKLETFDISENSIEDVMSEAHFSKLFNLKRLRLSSNSRLALSISSDWIPPFQLVVIELGKCKLGPQFPKWLQTQKNCGVLNISGSGISDNISDAFWNLPIGLDLDMSNNEIRGEIQCKKSFGGSIDLSSNQFEGSIPFCLLEATAVNLSKNKFSDLSSLCDIHDTYLAFLDVSYNQLSGKIPDCFSHMTDLRILILENNKFSGKIPVSLGLLTQIEIMHLGSNNFTGGLPSSLKNCTKLLMFDIGGNKLSGQIPTWMGKSLTKLAILSLRSNHFNGIVPVELCNLVHLQLLDLSSNDLFSSIPNCLGNITAMKETNSTGLKIEEPYEGDRSHVGVPVKNERLFLIWKGALSEFKNLKLLRNIDLSSNKLTGEIPREITELLGLVSLNLSRNNLSGRIPPEIGRLKSLDALDLSRNHLFGQIPSSLSQIDRLNTLDLSSNNLSGKIPTGTQLQTRDADAYMGNPKLCGDPLPKKCPHDEQPTISGATEDANDNEEEEEFITKGFYISAAIGFIVAFWGVCGTLIFNKSWRYSFHNLLNNTGDWLFVTVAVHKAKLIRMIKG